MIMIQKSAAWMIHDDSSQKFHLLSIDCWNPLPNSWWIWTTLRYQAMEPSEVKPQWGPEKHRETMLVSNDISG